MFSFLDVFMFFPMGALIPVYESLHCHDERDTRSVLERRRILVFGWLMCRLVGPQNAGGRAVFALISLYRFSLVAALDWVVQLELLEVVDRGTQA